MEALSRRDGEERRAGKRVWPTEFGWASGRLGKPGLRVCHENTEEEQADYIVRAYQMAKNWGWVGPMFLWNLDYNATPTERPHSDITASGSGRPRRHAEVIPRERRPEMAAALIFRRHSSYLRSACNDASPPPGKRIVTEFAMILAFILLTLAPGLPAASAQSTTPQATIVADVLNVRGGPGTAYAVVGQAKAGQTYPITGKSADAKWLVLDLGGKQGWVLGQYVKAGGALDGLAVVKAPAAPKAAAKACRRPPTCAAGFLRLWHPDRPVGRSRRGHRCGAGVGLQLGEIPVAVERFRGRRPGRAQLARRYRWGLERQRAEYPGQHRQGAQLGAPGNTDLAVEGPPADPGTYASFVGEFAARYCGRVQAIEVWNEQNLHYEWGDERWTLRATSGFWPPPTAPSKPHARA